MQPTQIKKNFIIYYTKKKNDSLFSLLDKSCIMSGGKKLLWEKMW